MLRIIRAAKLKGLIASNESYKRQTAKATDFLNKILDENLALKKENELLRAEAIQAKKEALEAKEETLRAKQATFKANAERIKSENKGDKENV